MSKNDAFPFPPDLLDAQVALHRTRAAYEEYALTLPWSVVPMPGWEGDKQLHSGNRATSARMALKRVQPADTVEA